MERNEVLLIEDNMDEAILTRYALDRDESISQFTHLMDGVEALDYLFGTGKYNCRNTAQLPKTILLDLKMPKLSGMEVLQKIKADERTKGISVIVLVSSPVHPDIEKCYLMGASGHIVKPVSLENYRDATRGLGMC